MKQYLKVRSPKTDGPYSIIPTRISIAVRLMSRVSSTTLLNWHFIYFETINLPMYCVKRFAKLGIGTLSSGFILITF